MATERRPEGVSITFFARWRAKSVRPERNRTNLRRFDRHRTGRRPHSRARSNWSAVSFRVVLFLDTVEQSIGDFTQAQKLPHISKPVGGAVRIFQS